MEKKRVRGYKGMWKEMQKTETQKPNREINQVIRHPKDDRLYQTKENQRCKH